MSNKRRRHPAHGSRGNAIIAALLVVVIVVTIGGKLLMTQETWVAQVHARTTQDTSREAVQASLHWARSVLNDDAARTQEDHLGEPWAQPMPQVAQDDMLINGSIEDEQAKFDLNSMVQEGKPNTNAISAFTRLLSTLNLSTTLAGAVVDWIDADDESTGPGGAESAYYGGRSPAYRAPNAAIGTIDELLYVRGFDAGILNILKPFITALPTPVNINLNTASAEVLSAMIPKLPLDAARQIVATRRSKPFTSVEEFTSRLSAEARESVQAVGVQSQFFMAHGDVVTDKDGERSAYRIRALVQRRDKKWPLVVWQRPD